MRFAVDTNILAYAVNRDCDQPAAARALETWLSGSAPWALTWNVVYEFLRLSTHPRIFRRRLSAVQALEFLDPILASDLVTVLGPSPRHEAVLLHTAVLMREHGLREIMTADADFRKFSFLTVTDPAHAGRRRARSGRARGAG